VLCIALCVYWSKKASAELDPGMARLIAEKRALAKEIAASETDRVPNGVWKCFDLLERNKWQQASNVCDRLRREAGRYHDPNIYGIPPPTTDFRSKMSAVFAALRPPRTPSALVGPLYHPVYDALGAAESFHDWDNRLLHKFGRDIIDSIPTNSIYFGGTDSGRFVVTALSESHRHGKPFFTLAQNALPDGSYLHYLRRMYSDRIYIPTDADVRAAFNDLYDDAWQHTTNGQREPEEVMAFNWLLVKTILKHNPEHEFYVEESFPSSSMYPQLSPHGLILKLNREELPELTEFVTQADHEYWRRYAAQLVGDWMKDETSVKQVCDFGEKVYLRKDLSGFTGDPAFARCEAAQKSFSKLRSSIGGLYAWRQIHAVTAEEKARMGREADYAFRQALALCPCSLEVVSRYVKLLSSEKRTVDALLVAETCERFNPGNAQIIQMVEQLKSAQ